MSNLKYDALIASGIVIGERVALPPDLVRGTRWSEIEAKKAPVLHAGSGWRPWAKTRRW